MPGQLVPWEIYAHYKIHSKESSHFINCCVDPHIIDIIRVIFLGSNFISFEESIIVYVCHNLTELFRLEKQLKVVQW